MNPKNAPSANAQNRLLLLDGSSYLYRAYHAMPDLRHTMPDGSSQATGAIRGILNMLQALHKEYPSAYAACVFDAPGPTFRDALYPQYKANRSPMPDDLRSQIAPIHELVALMGWKVITQAGVEADDVIATLAQTAVGQDCPVLIISGDKDLVQLVTEHITIVDTMSKKVRDEAGVEAEFGVPPALMLDYQTLIGDTVDNVPGVPKVGPKTAVKWLKEYGNLAGIIANADAIGAAVGANLRLALPWLPQAQAILRMKTDCDLQAVLPALPALDDLLLPCATADESALLAFYQRYGFKTLSRSLKPATDAQQPSLFAPNDSHDNSATAAPPSLAAQPNEQEWPQPAVPPLHYETISTWEQLEAWIARIEKADLVALDTETDSLDSLQARLVGLSLSDAPGQAAYLPLGHNYPGAPAQLPLDAALARLRGWLEDPKQAKLGQNNKYDMHVFANHGIEVRGYQHDTMLQSYVLEAHKAHSLSSLALRHLGRTGVEFEELCGKGAAQISFAQVDIERASHYACEDAELTLALHHVLWPRIEADTGLRRIYAIEMPSSQTLFTMERHGIRIDPAALRAQSQDLALRLLALESKAHSLAGQTFNLASPKQIGEILFGKLGLPVIKKTPKGEPSTDEEVLEKLAEDYPLPATILEARSLAKLKNTYTDKLPALIQPSTGRIHTHYAQAVAVTGRLASNEPNLQNIPIRTADGRRVRAAFIADPGHLLMSADYSQIELRIMAHLSEDAALCAAFADGQDVHRATAAEIFATDPHSVGAEQRRYAKTINFGLIYGMSAFGLAKALHIDNTAAKNYIQRYFERYPGVKRYMDDTRNLAKTQGYVETIFGRRLYLPEINSPNGPRRAAAERAAINAPMQGSAADLIKLSMNAVQTALENEAPEVKLVLQVHDELVLEVPQTQTDWVRQRIPAIMAGVATLRVPLLVEIGQGENWDQAH